MLDIESKLKNDKSGAYKKELLGKFNSFEIEVRSELNKGLTPDEYQNVSKLMQAVEASISIIEKY